MKPILFNTEMVQAILDNRKTQTRRLVKVDLGLADIDENDKDYFYVPNSDGEYHHILEYSKIHIGDILYVRETWARESEYCIYKADLDDWSHLEDLKWRPSIHMPKEDARLFLKVTDVRVERLQDITEKGAMAEGVDWTDNRCYENNGWKPSFYDPDSGGSPVFTDGFIGIWDEIYANKGFGWDDNPWVWVIEFERCEK